MILLFSFLVNVVDGFWFYFLSFLFLEVNLQRFKNYAITPHCPRIFFFVEILIS